MSEGADPQIVVERVRAAFESGRTRPLSWRMRQLEALDRLLRLERPALQQALHDDLGKAPAESLVTELGVLAEELRHTRRHLRRWLRPRRSPVPWQLLPASAATVLEPLGVALVIAPWNYPVLLALSPVIGALAAGDAVVLKPSELAPAVSRLLAELLPHYLDPEAVAVFEGGVDETTALLKRRFDLVFYTGSTRVGRIVMAAAAEHLTPVVLELGGKSPAYVDAHADIDATAKRIAWGKFVNAGQTCVAPDYVLATAETSRRLVPALGRAIRELWGEHPLANPDYARIVGARQYDRLEPLLADGTVAVGGATDRAGLGIAPTVLTDVRSDASVLQEEIFGPILPIVEVADEDAAIAYVAEREKPLALYVFTGSRASKRRWLTRTSSGALCFDISIAHLMVPSIPFGGVGESGMGAYHGRTSLAAFSHEKAVFAKPQHPDTVRLVHPPYTPGRDRLIARLLK